jgi:hypothetical protein
MLKSPNNNNSNNVMNNNTMSLATSAVHNMASTAVALSGEFMGNDYNNKMANTERMFAQRDRLTDGLNNITKSILQQRGVTGQLDQHENIPLRPLLLNGNRNQTSTGNNHQSQQNE